MQTVQKGNILIILVVVVLALGAIIYFQSSVSIPPAGPSPEPASSGEQTKTFKSSSAMKFTIEVPSTYQVIEKLGSATINTYQGSILIGQNGTNFDNLNDYIENSRNNLKNKISDQEELMLNGLEAIRGYIGNEKIYFIYVENTVYSLSTNSESLYDDLDQIAQSFRYTP